MTLPPITGGRKTNGARAPPQARWYAKKLRGRAIQCHLGFADRPKSHSAALPCPGGTIETSPRFQPWLKPGSTLGISQILSEGPSSAILSDCLVSFKNAAAAPRRQRRHSYQPRAIALGTRTTNVFRALKARLIPPIYREHLRKYHVSVDERYVWG